MNPFDSTIFTFFNGFVHRSWAFDTFVSLLAENHLLKGGLIVALIWWAWFRPAQNQADTRRYLLAGMLACLFSVIVARSLAHLLPFRARPMANPLIHFQHPYSWKGEGLIDWSSFPSDHAAVFFALAACIFFVWRAAGVVALCHAFFFICLPRIYLGYHFPTDILGGAVIGISMAYLSRTTRIREAVGNLAAKWTSVSPGSFYACLFLLTFQIVSIFQPLRDIVHYFSLLVRGHAS
jgi:undecaprenyl-diphosphatase